MRKAEIFLDKTQKEGAMKRKNINKLDFIKVENCTSKDTIRKIKRQATDREKVFVIDKSDEGLTPRIIRNLFSVNDKNINNSF